MLGSFDKFDLSGKSPALSRPIGFDNHADDPWGRPVCLCQIEEKKEKDCGEDGKE